MNEYEKEKKKIKRYIAKAKKDMRLSSVPRNTWENFYNGLEKKLMENFTSYQIVVSHNQFQLKLKQH